MVRWPAFRCGRFVLLSVPAVALLGALAWFILVNRPLAAVDPQELFTRALAQTKGAKSYAYRLRTQLITPRGARCLSDLHGVRVLPDRVSVRGKIFNAPVAIVQVGGVTYIKDSFSERWLTLEGERLGEAGVFTTELDPLVLLDFTTPPTVSTAKRVRGKKETFYLVEFAPAVKNRFLNAQFRDFHYRVTIAPERCYIVSVAVGAQSKNAPTRLAVTLDLGDFNKPFRIEPPVQQQ